MKQVRAFARLYGLSALFLICYSGDVIAVSSRESEGTNSARTTSRVTRDDLLIVIPCNTGRLHLVKYNRIWRKGIRTFVIVENQPDNQTLQEDFSDPDNEYKEHWATYREVLGEKKALPGDLRAAIAPFLAHKHFNGTYKWVLYGDDDTLWVVDNLLRYLDTLDHNMPYLISDALWFLNKGPPGSEQHHSDEAPRCITCGYEDPLLDNGQCYQHGPWHWHAPLGCPCTPTLLCHTHQTENMNNTFNQDNCDMIRRPNKPWAPRPGFWYMIHGGAGALLSSGLMSKVTFQQVEAELAAMWKHSGDAMMFEIVWNLLGIAPSSPGYSYCRENIQMFDPGFYNTDLGGKGGDPLGVIERLEWSLQGNGQCDRQCEDQLQHTLTVHIRARFTNFSVEWLENNPTVPTAAPLRAFLDKAWEQNWGDDVLGAKLSAFFMQRLTLLFDQYFHPELYTAAVQEQSTREMNLTEMLSEEFLEDMDSTFWTSNAPYIVLWVVVQVLVVVLMAIILEALTGWGFFHLAGIVANRAKGYSLQTARVNSW